MTHYCTHLGREQRKVESKDTVRTRPKEAEISGSTESLATKKLLLLDMENGENISCGQSNRHRGPQSNADIATLVMDWAKSSNINTLFTTTTTTTTTTSTVDVGSSHAPLFPYHSNCLHQHHNHCQQLSLYAGDGTHLHPDPHLMCLKLGKRHYLDDANNPAAVTDQQMPLGLISIDKRDKPYFGNVVGHAGPSSVGAVAAAPVPRCQVDGCYVALVNAKDYHRRHKVCQMHSKAPKVIVLGLEQRFCQQCSRFHAVSEFDDSKRSCRRRLAGHNQRRRKSSHDSVSKYPSKDKFMAARIPHFTSQTGRALSLLSSKTDPWISSSDLSSRSSAALHELIAEHRAAVLARQLILDRNHASEGLVESHPGCSHAIFPHLNQMSAEQHNYGYQSTDAQVTLDLMQAPRSAFGLLSRSGKSN